MDTNGLIIVLLLLIALFFVGGYALRRSKKPAELQLHIVEKIDGFRVEILRSMPRQLIPTYWIKVMIAQVSGELAKELKSQIAEEFQRQNIDASMMRCKGTYVSFSVVVTQEILHAPKDFLNNETFRQAMKVVLQILEQHQIQPDDVIGG